MLHRVRKHAQARPWLKTAGTRPGGGIGSGESEGQKRTAHRDVVSIRAHLVRGCRVVDELTSRATVAVPHPPEGKAFASVCLSPSRELRVRRETSSVAITKQRKRINGDLPIARLRRLLWHSCCRRRCRQSRGPRPKWPVLKPSDVHGQPSSSIGCADSSPRPKRPVLKLSDVHGAQQQHQLSRLKSQA